MMKNIFKLIFCVAALMMISCSSMKDKNAEEEIPVVIGENIPVLEIEPYPYNPETDKSKPGENYYNLLQPVISEDADEGLLVIKTNVPDVEVSLNSRVLGNSDLGIKGVVPRIYILGLCKEGYKEESLFLSVGENKKQVFFVEMEKLSSF